MPISKHLEERYEALAIMRERGWSTNTVLKDKITGLNVVIGVAQKSGYNHLETIWCLFLDKPSYRRLVKFTYLVENFE